MFTGIITHLAEVQSFDGEKLIVQIKKEESQAPLSVCVGSSVALDGVCLTVVDIQDHMLTFEVVPETVAKSRLQSVQAGDLLNVEFCMPATGRFEGHIVQGHVDACGTLLNVSEDGNSHMVKVQVPSDLSKYIVSKGSITLNGISLTIVEAGDDFFTVAIIPHTWEYTNLHTLQTGDLVNIEVDIVAKYVERLNTSVVIPQ